MEYLINRLTFSSSATTGRTVSPLSAIIAAFDRLEAAISVAHAHKSRLTPNQTDMQTLGFRAD